MIADAIEDCVRVGWSVSNLINNNGTWQANVTDGQYVYIGTGTTIEEALYNTMDAEPNGELFHLAPYREPTQPSGQGLLQAIGLAKPRSTNFKRRV